MRQATQFESVECRKRSDYGDRVTDRVSKATRSRIMASVGSKNTGPEMAVRRALHRLGYRYRLASSELPGRPDLVFPSRRKAIFVNGCFWHGHRCRNGQLPKSKLDYWGPKIAENQRRDRRQRSRLAAMGWSSKTVWECRIRKDLDRVIEELTDFLDNSA